jgi:hypothetical protein
MDFSPLGRLLSRHVAVVALDVDSSLQHRKIACRVAFAPRDRSASALRRNAAEIKKAV